MLRISVENILEYLGQNGYDVQYEGSKDIVLEGYCQLEKLKSHSITWIKKASEDSLYDLTKLTGGIVVTDKKILYTGENIGFIITHEPKAIFFGLLKKFWANNVDYKIAPSSVVESKNVADKVSIGQNCYIGSEVTIGTGTVIEHNVSIYHRTRIGENCIIHSGTVIGADGFGYCINSNGQPEKVEHFGGVYIGDEVEIGANTCIDRGTLGDTWIGSHVKIDNLVHIAHNVRIGESSMVVAGSIICGSAELENESYVAPGGIVKNQLKIGANAFVGMGAVVTQSVNDNMVVVGVPAQPIRETKIGDK